MIKESFMKQLLQDIVNKSNGYIELRYHKRSSTSLMAQKGRVDTADKSETQGVGIRALVDGAFGFAATSDISKKGIESALEEARKSAKILAEAKEGEGATYLAKGDLATEDYITQGYDEIVSMPVSEKLHKVVDYEKELAESSSSIHSARCRYREVLEEKTIVTSDGASASVKLAQPELSISAIAEKDGERTTAYKAAGVAGGWLCLLNHPTLDNMIADTSKLATDLLKAKYPEGGKKDVILSPGVVGLLCHEAIGHTVEADFVKSGSVAEGMIGERVASNLVSLYDSGMENFAGYATANIPFDDEGVKTEATKIIENGILTSYLHNRETAHEFGVKPTGNARAWLYSDEPIIRMRNTYLLPGNSDLSDMIAAMDDGYLVEGEGSGQADSNGEFMFGCSHVWEIKNGKKVRLLREATLSGIAFDVLKSVNAVSKEFLWSLGSGYCGKGQPAKVDAGGPYIRCKINVGGR